MARPRKNGSSGSLDLSVTADYRHTGVKRKNVPPATMAAEGTVPKVAKARYAYSPHLPPVLRFDGTGKADALPGLLAATLMVAVAVPGGEIHLFEGEVEGEIINEERGDHGFGYDRLFDIPAANKTLAELDLEEKNNFSHRAAAIKKALPYLLSSLSGEITGV